jgi:soluble lytic murein transglycosylase-like protein
MNIQQIKQTYGSLIGSAALKWKIRPEVIGGIIMHESSGIATAIGVDGTDHGLMQINNVSWPAFFVNPDDWKDPSKNINTGCAVLNSKRKDVVAECEKFEVTATEEQIERCMIAAYNCGADHTVHCLRHGLDIDTFTANKNYSAIVLKFASEYLST